MIQLRSYSNHDMVRLYNALRDFTGWSLQEEIMGKKDIIEILRNYKNQVANQYNILANCNYLT